MKRNRIRALGQWWNRTGEDTVTEQERTEAKVRTEPCGCIVVEDCSSYPVMGGALLSRCGAHQERMR